MNVLDKYRNLGRQYGLEAMRALLQALGNPQEKLDIIHVAGTNGKGSTISYMHHAFLAAAIPVMTFTSPQVTSYLDRYTINGEAVKKEAFDRAAEKVVQVADAIATVNNRHATIFEMELAVAFVLAEAYEIKLFIMETGLGGRLDATNAVDNQMATVFTSISLDHSKELGDSVAAISREKAGIIKEDVPVFSTVQKEAAKEVLSQVAKAKKAKFHLLQDSEIELEEADAFGQQFRYCGEVYQIPMLGKEQLYNASLAVMVLNELPPPYRLDKAFIKKGLKETRWAGSFEIIDKWPNVILDGAHNPGAAAALSENIKYYFSDNLRYGILHVFKDKDVANILKAMRNVFSLIYLPEIKKRRSLPAAQLQELCAEYLPETKTIITRDIAEAAKSAKEIAKPEDLIVVFGSLSHLKEAREVFEKIDEDKEND